MINPDHTLDDDIWKDSFDRLLNKRSLLRELNVLKPNVRVSFNNDSSIEVSRENVSALEKLEDKIKRRRTHGTISTPKIFNKAHGPFDCNISPISTWRLSYTNQIDGWNSTSCVLKSVMSDGVPETICENEGTLFFNRKTSASIQRSLPSNRQGSSNVPSSSNRQSSSNSLISLADQSYSNRQISLNGQRSLPSNRQSSSNVPSSSNALSSSNGPSSSNRQSSSNENSSSSKQLNSVPRIEINGEKHQEDPKAIENIRNVSNAEDNDRNISMLLPPGKWRKSLTVWKRLNQPKHECLDSFSAANNTHQFTLNIRNSRKTIFLGRKTKTASLSISPKRKSELELLKLCKQTKVLAFGSLYSSASMQKCRKIGEGTYGEVFVDSTDKNAQTVIKIIPIEGDMCINGEPQKTFETILPEVMITSELSNLRLSKSFATSGFVLLKNTRYFRGKYPNHFIELWDLYERTYGSENDHPEVFKDDQLYVSLEIEFGGKDLEGYVFRNSEQAYSTFLQIAYSLAVAEKLLQFEHRDLHVGNILIQPTKEKNIECLIDKRTVLIPTNGVKVTIIDYTLSRMLLNKFTFYNDLSADDELFCAKGDYQYDIYRLMKEKLDNNWEKYEPYTNVLWLHYVLTKLIDCTEYKNNKSKQHKMHMDRLTSMRDQILSYDSANDFISVLKI